LLASERVGVCAAVRATLSGRAAWRLAEEVEVELPAVAGLAVVSLAVGSFVGAVSVARRAILACRRQPEEWS